MWTNLYREFPMTRPPSLGAARRRLLDELPVIVGGAGFLAAAAVIWPFRVYATDREAQQAACQMICCLWKTGHVTRVNRRTWHVNAADSDG